MHLAGPVQRNKRMFNSAGLRSPTPFARHRKMK